MNITLAAFDMDGTLLNHQERIGARNAAAIRALQDRGVVVTIASGRSFREAREICAASGVNAYIISSNGAEINDRSGKSIAGFPIDRALAMEIAAWLDENEYYYELTGDDDVFAVAAVRARHTAAFEQFKRENPSPEALARGIGLEYKLSLRAIGSVASREAYFEQQKNTYKIHVLSPDLTRLAAAKDLLNRFSDRLEMSSSLDHNTEAMDKAASKGAAVQKLAEMLGLSLHETLAIGDNYNDLSMLQRVGYPVAMGNAKAEVKAVCRYTTLRDDEDGVAHAIESLAQIEWR